MELSIKQQIEDLADYYIVLVNELKSLQRREQAKKQEINIVLNKVKELKRKS